MLAGVRRGIEAQSRRALVGAELAPQNEATLSELQQRRPQAVLSGIQPEVLNDQPDALLDMDRKIFAECLRKAPLGKHPLAQRESSPWQPRPPSEEGRGSPRHRHKHDFQEAGRPNFGTTAEQGSQGFVFAVSVCIPRGQASIVWDTQSGQRPMLFRK